jgi:hypothetical protein
MTSHATRDNQLTANSQRKFLHVIVVNFSVEENELPKATVLGVAEEIPPCVIAALNGNNYAQDSTINTARRAVYTVGQEEKFRRYLHTAL